MSHSRQALILDARNSPRSGLGRGLVDRKLVEAPSNFITGRPNAALLFWFFSNFRCGVW